MAIWLALLGVIWWPYLTLTSGHPPPGVPNARANELVVMLPIVLFMVAWTPAGMLIRRNRWRLHRVILELIGMTAILWLALIFVLAVSVRYSGVHVSAPELSIITLFIAFLSAVQPVRWMERQRELSRPAPPRPRCTRMADWDGGARLRS